MEQQLDTDPFYTPPYSSIGPMLSGFIDKHNRPRVADERCWPRPSTKAAKAMERAMGIAHSLLLHPSSVALLSKIALGLEQPGPLVSTVLKEALGNTRTVLLVDHSLHVDTFGTRMRYAPSENSGIKPIIFVNSWHVTRLVEAQQLATESPDLFSCFHRQLFFVAIGLAHELLHLVVPKALELLASRGLTSRPNGSKDYKVDGWELELGLLGGQLEGLWDLGDPPSPEREDNMPFEIIDGTQFGIEEPREGNIGKAVEDVPFDHLAIVKDALLHAIDDGWLRAAIEAFEKGAVNEVSSPPLLQAAPISRLDVKYLPLRRTRRSCVVRSHRRREDEETP